ncbi:MAG: cytochrome c3 family protein [bacterium]
MKKNIVILVVLLVLGGSLTYANITGSKHDFHNQSWSSGQICLPCHAPHNNINSTGTLLWNHAASSASYTFYSSPTMKASAPIAMSAISKTCMSCHDGTVAIDSFGGVTGSTTISSTNNLGTALGNDHPISVDYTTALAASKGHMFDPAVAPSGLGGTIAVDMLYVNKVECSSCHDVHNNFSIPGMLKKSNAGSALCLTCHNR